MFTPYKGGDVMVKCKGVMVRCNVVAEERKMRRDVLVCHTVVWTRQAMSSSPASGSAHLADAALHQSSSAVAQHWPIHARPRRTADAHGVAEDARNISRYVNYIV